MSKPQTFSSEKEATRYAALERRYEAAVEKFKGSGEMAVRAGAAGTTGFAIGAIEGRWGDAEDPTEIRGVPVAMGVSLAGYVGAFLLDGDAATASEQAGHCGLAISLRDYGRQFGKAS